MDLAHSDMVHSDTVQPDMVKADTVQPDMVQLGIIQCDMSIHTQNKRQPMLYKTSYWAPSRQSFHSHPLIGYLLFHELTKFLLQCRHHQLPLTLGPVKNRLTIPITEIRPGKMDIHCVVSPLQQRRGELLNTLYPQPPPPTKMWASLFGLTNSEIVWGARLSANVC